MARHIVATTDEIPDGGRKLVTIRGREIGIFRRGALLVEEFTITQVGEAAAGVKEGNERVAQMTEALATTTKDLEACATARRDVETQLVATRTRWEATQAALKELELEVESAAACSAGDDDSSSSSLSVAMW